MVWALHLVGKGAAIYKYGLSLAKFDRVDGEPPLSVLFDCGGAGSRYGVVCVVSPYSLPDYD
jgi:hypothetical protein